MIGDVSDSYDLIVIGGGLAGLTAAATAARLGMGTLVLTGDVLGGHLVSIASIDGFPGHPEGIAGFDLCPATEELASEAGAELRPLSAQAVRRDDDGWTVQHDGGIVAARAVVLASGTRLKTLGVAGERRLFGKGVSHCASCDAALLRNKPVAVIGGGDSALQEALTLVPVAAHVAIITQGEALTAQQAYRRQLERAGNVTVWTNTMVLEIMGEASVSGVRIASGGAEHTLAVDGVFVFIGLEPNTSSLLKANVLDQTGFVQVDANMRTTEKGLYAAGTVRSGSIFRAVSAAGDGAIAAYSAFADATAGSDP